MLLVKVNFLKTCVTNWHHMALMHVCNLLTVLLFLSRGYKLKQHPEDFCFISKSIVCYCGSRIWYALCLNKQIGKILTPKETKEMRI